MMDLPGMNSGLGLEPPTFTEDPLPPPDKPTMELLKEQWNAFKQGATDAVDSFLHGANFPNLLHRETWGGKLVDFVTPSLSNFVPPPVGLLELMWECVSDKNTLMDFAGMKVRYPLLQFSDSMVMAAMAQRIAADPPPGGYKTFGIRTGLHKFDLLSRTGVFDTMHTVAEVYRTNYTLGRLARYLKPWTNHEAVQRLRQTYKDVQVEPSEIEKVLARNGKEFSKTYRALVSSVLQQVSEESLDSNDFPIRYNSNIFYNKLPYERFRNEAVCRIDDFYLFLDEVSDYKETYTYPFHMMNTLTSNYFYKSGGVTQNITIKATLLYINRKSFDYFVRLGNRMEPLRFYISHDDQERTILIQSIVADHRFQPAPMKYDNPKPAVSKFTIQAAVFGAPLPPFKAADYGNDPTLAGKVIKNRREQGRK